MSFTTGLPKANSCCSLTIAVPRHKAYLWRLTFHNLFDKALPYIAKKIKLYIRCSVLIIICNYFFWMIDNSSAVKCGDDGLLPHQWNELSCEINHWTSFSSASIS